MKTVLYKIGGSLLTVPHVGQRVEALLRSRDREEFPLLIVGGGRRADEVRKTHRTRQVSEERSHKRALAAMDGNVLEIIDDFPNACRVTDPDHLGEVLNRKRRRAFLMVSQLLERLESRYDLELPHSWDATSDSIGAWLTIILELDELRLLKSIPPVPWKDLAAGETTGVDKAFPGFLPQLPRLSWVNFRDDERNGENVADPVVHTYDEHVR